MAWSSLLLQLQTERRTYHTGGHVSGEMRTAILLGHFLPLSPLKCQLQPGRAMWKNTRWHRSRRVCLDSERWRRLWGTMCNWLCYQLWCTHVTLTVVAVILLGRHIGGGVRPVSGFVSRWAVGISTRATYLFARHGLCGCEASFWTREIEVHQQIHIFLLGFQALFSGVWLFNKCTRPGK